MKQTIAICAGVLALGLAGAQPATAQLVYPGYPVYPAYPGFAVIAPPEVVAIVRSNGMKPLTPPMRRGPVYLLHALDPNGQEVRVVVNARSGRVIAVRPTFGPRYAAVAPPYGRPPSGVPLAGWLWPQFARRGVAARCRRSARRRAGRLWTWSRARIWTGSRTSAGTWSRTAV